MRTIMDHDDWDLRESGPPGADHTVLLLAGALCTVAFFEDLMAEPKLTDASVHLVAATLPGFGNSQPPDDLSMESYASLAGRLAADIGCEAVLGHSLGANVAIEMAAEGKFSGPLVLLSPSFSRKDESKFPRALDHLGRVLGYLPYAAMFKVIGPAMKSSLPANRRDELIAELKKNDPRFVRRQTRRYLEYLDGYGSLAPPPSDSGVTSRGVFCEHEDGPASENGRSA